ncbi:ribonuclease H-like domain-containing protein [Tanacetum coccineum]
MQPSLGVSPLGLLPQLAQHYYKVASPPGFTMPLAQPTYLGLNAQPATQPTGQPLGQSAGQPGNMGPTAPLGQATMLPYAFTTGTLHNLASGAWNFNTSASSYLNNSVNSLSENFNMCMYPFVSVGDGHSIPVTNTGHSILPTPTRSLHLNNDFLTRRVLLRCDITGDLYLVTAPSPIPHAFLVSQHTWHQRLGHPGGEVMRRLVSSNFISYNKEKPPVLCHACQLGKHVRL